MMPRESDRTDPEVRETSRTSKPVSAARQYHEKAGGWGWGKRGAHLLWSKTQETGKPDRGCRSCLDPGSNKLPGRKRT